MTAAEARAGPAAPAPDAVIEDRALLEAEIGRFGNRFKVVRSGPAADTPGGIEAIAVIAREIAVGVQSGRLAKDGPEEWIAAIRVNQIDTRTGWALGISVSFDDPAYRDWALSAGEALSRHIRSGGTA